MRRLFAALFTLISGALAWAYGSVHDWLWAGIYIFFTILCLIVLVTGKAIIRIKMRKLHAGGWRNGRRAGLKNRYPCGVRVQVSRRLRKCIPGWDDGIPA
jgi:hypothetical protein